MCNSGEIDRFHIRSTLWRIFLNIIPYNTNYTQWVDQVGLEREKFKKKLKVYNNLKKISGDPLAETTQSDVIY